MSLSRRAAGAALVLAVGAGALAFSGGPAHAQSQPPAARIFGSVQVSGQNAQTGAVVTAYAGSTLCGTGAGQGLYNGTQYYVDIDSSNTTCSAAGTTISFKVNGVTANETTQIPSTPGSAVQQNLTAASSSGPSTSVTYQAGWNIVAGPSGQTFTTAVGGTLFTYQAGDSAYETLSSSTPITAGRGYWAYYSAPTTVTISGTSTLPYTVSAPAGQFIMVGNPSATNTVTVSGADVLYTYDPIAGQYTTATQLKPGQGGWVFSNAGGTVTLQ